MFDVKYLIVLPIEQMRQGDTYEAKQPLPLHCTVVQWFLPGEFFIEKALKHRLQAFIKEELKKEYIDLVSDKPELFGPNSDIPVHVLKRNPDLELLHTVALVHLAEHGGNLPEELRWSGAGYRPHVTTTPTSSFPPGTTYRAEHIALIGKNEYGDRKVLYTLPR